MIVLLDNKRIFGRPVEWDSPDPRPEWWDAGRYAGTVRGFFNPVEDDAATVLLIEVGGRLRWVDIGKVRFIDE